jgi:hypothetical protein
MRSLASALLNVRVALNQGTLVSILDQHCLNQLLAFSFCCKMEVLWSRQESDSSWLPGLLRQRFCSCSGSIAGGRSGLWSAACEFSPNRSCSIGCGRASEAGAQPQIERCGAS